MEGARPHASSPSHDFNQAAVISCISAARALLAFVPDEAGNIYSPKMLPWCSLLHCITQADAVLVLELRLKVEHMLSQVQELVEDVRKVMAWLAEMTADSLSAWRCWDEFSQPFSQATVGYSIRVVELVTCQI